MSTTPSKNKEKRSRSSSEANNSFVKNVTSRVSGLLPSTITKWFSSPSSSNTNGSAQVTDATDSSTEDEAPESPVPIQPPAKRMRYTSPGNFNQFVQVETRCTSTNTETLDDSFNINNQPMERINFRKEKNLSHIQSSNESPDASAQDNFFKSQHSLSSPVHSMASKRKSLFDNSYNESYRRPSPTQAGSLKDPYFKPSLLSSPFYVGRTMYGGAASSYMTQPNIKERNISLTEETVNSNSVNMSHSARRVLDLLEHYSSPLIEAKRIPPVERDSFDSTIKSTAQKSLNQYESKVNSFKNRELYVPTVASILTIKRRSRLMDTTNAARQIIASHSSSSEFLPYPKTKSECHSQKEATGDKLTTKVKSRITRANRERNIIADNNSADNVSLPNVVLQIDKDNLPKFTFGTSQPSLTSNNSSIQTPAVLTTDTLKHTNEIDQSDSSKDNNATVKNPLAQLDENKIFKFSSPVRITTESTNVMSTPPKFYFGSSERDIEKIEEVEKNDDNLLTNITSKTAIENKLPPQQSSTWKCLDCWVLNKTDVENCVCCGGKKPLELEADTNKSSLHKVADSQSQSETSTKSNNIDNLFVAKVKNSSKWKCNDCWVDNDESADKCVCCGGKNPKNAVVPVSSEKKIEEEWKCNDCWIKNKNTLDKCAACSAAKPGTKINSSTISSPNINDKATTQNQGTLDNTFKSIAKSQRDRWECPICLVRNEANKSKCSCCEADKPGTVSESHKRLFNFHQPSEVTFKFGIQPKTQEVPKKQENIETEESNMGEEPTNNETNNNVLPKTPTFNFGSMPMKKIDEQVGPQSIEAPKVNFTFGVPKNDLVPPVLETTNKLPEAKVVEEKEKVQEVPQVFPPPQPDGFLKVSASLFKAPVSSQNSQEVVAQVPIQLSTTSKENTFFNTSVTSSSSNTEVKTQQNNFTFSSIRPATNLFATTTTVATNITSPITLSSPGTTTMSIFQKAEPATTTVSFFQTPASKTTTAMSLFPKAESTTTTTTPTVSVSATPVFSFGSLGQTSQADKPKFQFTFGTNKTETPSLFKPTFGVSNDNNVSSNKFNIPSNSITSGNGLTANPMNNTTPVNTGNALTTDNSLAPAPAPGLFGTPLQKDWKLWSANNNALFPSNTTPNTVQKPPTFTFGTSTPFNSQNTAFGNATTQPTQNVFGIPATVSQPIFGNQLNNQTTTNIFGSPQPQSNSMPMGMFGTMPNTGGTPAFGTSNPSMPTFETPSLTPAPAPTFNFGGQQQPNIFGFGQTQPNPPLQEGQPPQPGMYNFVPPGGAPQQLQFNMGSAPNTGNTGRRVIRKAMRRTQR